MKLYFFSCVILLLSALSDGFGFSLEELRHSLSSKENITNFLMDVWNNKTIQTQLDQVAEKWANGNMPREKAREEDLSSYLVQALIQTSYPTEISKDEKEAFIERMETIKTLSPHIIYIPENTLDRNLEHYFLSLCFILQIGAIGLNTKVKGNLDPFHFALHDCEHIQNYFAPPPNEQREEEKRLRRNEKLVEALFYDISKLPLSCMRQICLATHETKGGGIMPLIRIIDPKNFSEETREFLR